MSTEIDLSDLTPEEVAAAPETFQELARMTSVREAVLMCQMFGGEELKIPAPGQCPDGVMSRNGEPRRVLIKESYLRQSLLEILTPGSYGQLLSECGGTRLYVPFVMHIRRIRRDRLIVEAVDAAISAGRSTETAIRELIRQHELSRSYIFRILKQGGRELAPRKSNRPGSVDVRAVKPSKVTRSPGANSPSLAERIGHTTQKGRRTVFEAWRPDGSMPTKGAL